MHWSTLVRGMLRPFGSQILCTGTASPYLGILAPYMGTFALSAGTLAIFTETLVRFGPIPIESGMFGFVASRGRVKSLIPCVVSVQVYHVDIL